MRKKIKAFIVFFKQELLSTKFKEDKENLGIQGESQGRKSMKDVALFRKNHKTYMSKYWSKHCWKN